MLLAEAHIPTDDASRYLTRLCRHASNMGRRLGGGHRALPHHSVDVSQPVQHVEWSDTVGATRLSDGQCILRATDGALVLSAEALENALRRLQNGIIHRLKKRSATASTSPSAGSRRSLARPVSSKTYPARRLHQLRP